MFVTIEGPEGSGKTTQAAALADRLRARGPVLLTREPGGTPIGEQIRAVLLSPQNTTLDPLAELFLYSAARAQLVLEVLLPALARGETVICVRYTDSTWAYQGGGGGLAESEIATAVRLATRGLTPDLTFLLDIDPEEGLRRRERARLEGSSGAEEGWNRVDAQELAYHERVRGAYLRLAARHPERIVTVDASQPFEIVSARIEAEMNAKLAARAAGGQA